MFSRQIRVSVPIFYYCYYNRFTTLWTLFRTTQVSQYQKGKTNLDVNEARDSDSQWHQLGHMQICTLTQTDNHANTHHSVFTGQMPFLPLNQQCQSTEGTCILSARVSLQMKNKCGAVTGSINGITKGIQPINHRKSLH